jgi:four helix bundle protein
MEKNLERRTKQFALQVIKFVSILPRTRDAGILARQLLRSATSIGANYREANRGVSRADFANKIGTVQKEASETQYWIELLIESGITSNPSAKALLKEATELLAIFTATGRTLSRQNKQ